MRTTAHQDEEGATAVEYALMLALIDLVIVAAVILLGQSVEALFSNEVVRTALN